MCKFTLTSLTACVHGVFLQDGSLVRQYKGASGIFEVCWSKAGDKLAACYSNNTVSVCIAACVYSTLCIVLQRAQSLCQWCMACFPAQTAEKAEQENWPYTVDMLNLTFPIQL